MISQRLREPVGLRIGQGQRGLNRAGVVELVDTRGLGPRGESCGGSSPFARTSLHRSVIVQGRHCFQREAMIGRFRWTVRKPDFESLNEPIH